MKCESAITIIYNKNILGCILFFPDSNSIVLCRDVYDSCESEQAKSIIYRYNVDYGIITTEMDVQRYDFIAETGIRMHFGLKKRKYGTMVSRFKECLAGKGFECAMESVYLLLNHIKIDYDPLPLRFFATIENVAEGPSNKFGTFIAELDFYSIYANDTCQRLYMSIETINSLKLINYIGHPNNLIKSKKECDSLLTRLNFTRTCMGYQLLKNNILFPFTQIDEIAQRHAAVEHLIDKKLTSRISHALKNCINIDANEFIFFRENKSEYFVKMYKMLSSVLEIISLMNGNNEMSGVPDTLKCYGDVCTYNDVMKTISGRIDFKNCKFRVKCGISKELDFLKNLYGDLENYLCEMVDQVRTKYDLGNTVNSQLNITKRTRDSQENTEHLSIVYFPQLGYLLESNAQNDKWELKFKEDMRRNGKTESSFFYKNEVMYGLDDEIGDIENEINDLELEIMNELKIYTEKHTSQIKMAVDYISRIDVINSLAFAALENGFVRPIVSATLQNENLRRVASWEVTECQDEAENAEHNTNEAYTAITSENDQILCNRTKRTRENEDQNDDTDLNNSNRVDNPQNNGTQIFLTEYNRLIEIGQTIVMHQIGSYVPLNTHLPIFDEMYSKITTNDNLKAHKSAFLSDILQISEVYKFNGDCTVLLMDEFGRGTNIYEGRALYQSILMHTDVTAIVCATPARRNKMAQEQRTETLINTTIIDTALQHELSSVEHFYLRYEQIKKGEYQIVTDTSESEWATKIINDYLFKQP